MSPKIERASPSFPSILSSVSALVGIGALAWALATLSPAPTRLGRALECDRAQLVNGELRCDEELLDSVRVAGVGRRPVEAGDAIETRARVASPPRVARMPPAQLAALAQEVDLNQASAAELASLAGIGPTLAERIIAARPYAGVDELIEVRGIGPKRLAAIRPRARVEPSASARRSATTGTGP